MASNFPPAWTNYKRSVTIDGNAYEELEYQFLSRKRKLTIHRRVGRDDGGLRRRRFHRTMEDIRANSMQNIKVLFICWYIVCVVRRTIDAWRTTWCVVTVQDCSAGLVASLLGLPATWSVEVDVKFLLLVLLLPILLLYIVCGLVATLR